jgi:arginyl-tRNA synthetase
MASTSTSTTIEELSVNMQALGVDSIPTYANSYPAVNVFDIYRSHITSLLVEVTGVDASIVYPALQWTNTPEKGDLLLAVPALRVKGKKPAELAAEWVEKVPFQHSYTQEDKLIL